jgi:hypothetical protein
MIIVVVVGLGRWTSPAGEGQSIEELLEVVRNAYFKLPRAHEEHCEANLSLKLVELFTYC